MQKAFEYPKTISIWAGTWPKNIYPLRYKLRTVINLGIIWLLTLCLVWNACFQIGNFVMFSKSLYILTSVLNTLVKVTTILFKRTTFLKVLKILDTASFQNYDLSYMSTINKFFKVVKKVQVCYRIQVNGCFVFIILFPVLESKPLPMDFPYFNNGTIHYPFYVFEGVSIFIAAYNNMALDLLTVGLIAIAAIQLKLLNRRLIDMRKNVKNLQNFSEENCEKLTMMYLEDCCVHYSDIEEYVTYFNEVFSLIVFVQLGTSVVTICNSGIRILSVELFSIEAISLFFYITTMIAQLGMYCWFGNFIYMESLQVITSCYMSEWYECNNSNKKMLFMLMERSKKPLEIRGVKLVPLSIDTFISILKWSYSYFALLRHYTLKLKNNN